MRFDCFEDILAWQKAKILAIDVYQASENSRDFGFKDQIRRASVSIMNNIAEGFERQTGKEFKQFLFIAKGSCAEVRSMLYLALELSSIKKEALDQMLGQTIEISKMLSGLIRVIRTD